MRRLWGAVLALSLLAACGANPASMRTPQYEPLRVDVGLPQCPELAPATAAPAVKALPSLDLECLGGQRRLKLSSLRGEPTLLVAFAQWCGPCRQELPVLARGLPGKKVRVLLVNSQESNYADAVELLKRTGVSYPVLIDEDKHLAKAVGVPGLPYTVLVSADGAVVDVHVGGWKSEDDLHVALRDKLGVE